MGISSMRIHHIVSQHFSKLFDDQSDLLSDDGAQTKPIENRGAIDCLRGDNFHTDDSTCSCQIDGGTPQQKCLLQLKEPNSVISEGIPRVQNELVRTPIPSQQLTSDSTESVLIEERFI
jgi:hypothetical protein